MPRRAIHTFGRGRCQTSEHEVHREPRRARRRLLRPGLGQGGRRTRGGHCHVGDSSGESPPRSRRGLSVPGALGAHHSRSPCGAARDRGEPNNCAARYLWFLHTLGKGLPSTVGRVPDARCAWRHRLGDRHLQRDSGSATWSCSHEFLFPGKPRSRWWSGAWCCRKICRVGPGLCQHCGDASVGKHSPSKKYLRESCFESQQLQRAPGIGRPGPKKGSYRSSCGHPAHVRRSALGRGHSFATRGCCLRRYHVGPEAAAVRRALRRPATEFPVPVPRELANRSSGPLRRSALLGKAQRLLQGVGRRPAPRPRRSRTSADGSGPHRDAPSALLSRGFSAGACRGWPRSGHWPTSFLEEAVRRRRQRSGEDAVARRRSL
mmetsp:Transcript_21536/g.37991  ORF Transcript_21536/g.37991 Transcript_21536/m.37991 type:complete len:376 (+) Transcript_21536:450-1577(+)